MRSLLRACLLGLLLAGAAQAGGPREFVPPKPLTPEEEAYLKSKGRGLKSYLNQMPEERPIPWLGIGLVLIALGSAAPFALRTFRETMAENREDLAPTPDEKE